MRGRFPYGGGSQTTPNFGSFGDLIQYGNVYFVDSNGGGSADSNAGTKRNPCTTIASAQAQCTANNGDIIVCAPGHAETVSAIAGMALTVAGITILGVGRGTAVPTITLDTAALADIDIDAANIAMHNIHFRANFADIAAGIDVNAANFGLFDCHFSEVATDMNAKIWVQDGAGALSDGLTIVNCTANLVDAVNTHFVNLAGTPKNVKIVNNWLAGDWGTIAVGGAGVITNALIEGNRIQNIATDADACINVAATATGLIAYNACTGGHATQGIVCGDMGSIENYYELNTSDLSGVLEPANA